MAAPKRRGKTISDYEKWEIQQLINSGEGFLLVVWGGADVAAAAAALAWWQCLI